MTGFPKAVLFDLGNTILTISNADLVKAFSKAYELARNPRGISILECGMVARQLADMLDGESNATRHEFPIAAYVRLLSDRTGLEFDMPYMELELEIWKAMHVFTPEPGVREALAALRERNVPMGVVSNAAFYAETLKWEMARHDILEPFQFVISSADCIFRKPHPEIFRAAASRLGFAPGDICFVGDVFEWDVAGARDAGMSAVWYNPKRAAPPVTENAAAPSWREIRSWAEFLPLA